MTKLRSLSPQPRCTVTYLLGHSKFPVPDLERSTTFYTGFGLDLNEEGSLHGFCTAGYEHRRVRGTEPIGGCHRNQRTPALRRHFMQDKDFDVLIAGVGPVGLPLAIELGTRGVSCRW